MGFPGCAIGFFRKPSNYQLPPISDPDFDKVVFLSHFDGANNSTTFTDIKGNSITRNGNVVISTAQSKFGGASAYFDGNGDYLDLGSSADFDISMWTDFTFEFWLYKIVNTSNHQVIFSRYAPNLTRYWFTIDSSNKPAFVVQNNGGNTLFNLVGAESVALNVWHHIALCKSGSNFYLYVNGNQNAIGSYNQAINSMGNFRIGILDLNSSQFAFYYNGYIDDFRITAAARYTSNFTPPTISFADN